MGEPESDGLPVDNFYRVAIFCGAAPLIAGVGTFLLWTITRWPFLMNLGIWILYGGGVLFVIGCVALLMHFALEAKALYSTRRAAWSRGLRALFLLLVNFPAAAVILSAAIFLESQYTVTIHNRTPHPLQQTRVEGGGVHVEIGTIPPGDSERRALRFMGDGNLRFTARYQGKTIERQVEGYVTSGLGGDAEIILTERNGVKVEIRTRWDQGDS